MHYLVLSFPFALILFAPWAVPQVRPVALAKETQ